jgi:hypothetical protein
MSEAEDTDAHRRREAKRLLTRRTALRAFTVGAAGVAGVAAAGAGSEVFAAAATPAPGQDVNGTYQKPPVLPQGHASANLPPNSQRWSSIAGLSFMPDVITNRLYSGGGGLYLANATGDCKALVDLPNGATITAIDFSYIRNDGNGMNFALRHYDTTGGNSDLITGTATAAPAATAAFGFLPAASPITVNPTNGPLYLVWTPGTASSTHVLYAGYVLWAPNNGLVLFSAPKRCFGDGTTYAADAVISNIDATAVIPSKGGGATGVPAGATAAFCAVQSYQPGVMTLYPTGSADPGLGNWAAQGTSAGTGIQMQYMMVPLNAAGKFNIHNNFTAKQIFVDVWGYVI